MGKHPNQREYTDLHLHLGSASTPHFLWELAHEQGLKLPSKDYWDFYNMITINKPHVGWNDYHTMFKWTELIQSSPLAIERTVYECVSGAYRINNITLIEPSFNPIFRNRGGERDLDQIILAALRGMERALIEFPKVKAGLILSLDRRLSYKLNEIIVKKAVKYKSRGIVGIDIAGPNSTGFDYADYTKLYQFALDNGIQTTVHTGEDGTIEEMEYVLQHLPLKRINHGIKASSSKKLMKLLVEKNITLCICPTSNLRIGFVKDAKQYRNIIQTLLQYEVKLCINTDSPALLKTNIIKEVEYVFQNKILTEKQFEKTCVWAHEASFVPLLKTKNNIYI